jgi:hypothetical protein
VAALSVLEEHFGDAWGFALAAVTVTDLVEARTVEPSLLVVLHRMNADGLELQGRCLDLAGRYPDDLPTSCARGRSTAAARRPTWPRHGRTTCPDRAPRRYVIFGPGSRSR